MATATVVVDGIIVVVDFVICVLLATVLVYQWRLPLLWKKNATGGRSSDTTQVKD